jgi:glutamyl-tRNA reductase
MARLAACAVVAAGGSPSIANRTVDRARALANETGGRVEELDPGPAIAGFAAVIVALAGPWTISSETVDALIGGSATVVDLSVPPAIDATAAAALGQRLITADDLAVRASEPSAEDGQIQRLDRLVDATAAEFGAWLAAGGRRAVARALADRAEDEREAHLEELWRQMPELGPDARVAIDRMSRHLTKGLLREPLERLGQDVDGRAERAARDLFTL